MPTQPKPQPTYSFGDFTLEPAGACLMRSGREVRLRPKAFAARGHARDWAAAGAPLAVYHFHDARHSPLNVGLSALELSPARDRIIFCQGELTGNIWLAGPVTGP